MKEKNEKHIERALAMKAKGIRVPDIADKLGYSEATIYSWIKQRNARAKETKFPENALTVGYGGTNKPKKLSQEQKAALKLIELLQEFVNIYD